jgi:hypothetical protein
MSSRLATPLSVLAIAGASIALVACGSSDRSSSGGGAATNASNGNATQNAAFEKYRQCLKDNGVTLPDRGRRPPTGDGDGNGGRDGAPGPFGGDGKPDAKTQKAMQACAKLRPQLRGGSGNRPQQDIKAFTPYLTCLKDQGLDVKVSDGFNALRDLKASDPEVQTAFKACRSKLPQRPSGNGTNNARPPQTTTSDQST